MGAIHGSARLRRRFESGIGLYPGMPIIIFENVIDLITDIASPCVGSKDKIRVITQLIKLRTNKFKIKIHRMAPEEMGY